MKRSLVLIALVLGLLLSIYFGMTLGYASISKGDIFSALASLFGRADNLSPATRAIILDIRLPRVLLALLTGVALAVSGLVMQAVVGNPVADPYILGISSGASLGATLAIVLGVFSAFGSIGVGVSAFCFALATALFVLFLAKIGGRATSERLILSGMAISTAASSLATLMVYTAKNRDAIREVSFWLMGSLSGAKRSDIALLGPVIVLLVLFLATQSRYLNLLLLGDEAAHSLGVDLPLLRTVYTVVVSVLVGLVVFTSGTIGFVGLIVPHMARFLVGGNHKHLLPVVVLLGGMLLMWADVVARNIIPGGELPTGVVVSVVGAPFFVYLIIQRGRKGAWS